MSTIKIENLTFSYYGYVKPIFENVSFSFDTNWKIGLIGRNGIGKSTLFKLLLNQEVYKGKNPLEMTKKEIKEYVKLLEKEMKEAAGNLQFERAAELRDRIFEYRVRQ